jgi:tRNA/rRNA methyltransferase
VNPELQNRIVVVLVRARNSNNIGAVARAMHDFGFPHLRIVTEYVPPLETARSAVDASRVLAEARTFVSVAEAVADCTLVVGTTAVGERALEHRLEALAQASGKILTEAANSASRVALLFGSEKTGLSNEELSHCHWLLTIPMYEHEEMRHPSMNLGQAVAVCAYELARAARPVPPGPALHPVTVEQRERLVATWLPLLERLGVTGPLDRERQTRILREMLVRWRLTPKDAHRLMGLARQVRHALGHRLEG